MIAALAVASWSWGWLPFTAPAGLNPLTWPPAFFSWFAAGMLLAEWTVSPIGLAAPAGAAAGADGRRSRAGAYLVAASPLAGPEGLTPGTAASSRSRRRWARWSPVALVAPLVLDRPDTPHRLLGSAAMVTLGRWSYGLFIWHLAALTMVFPVIGQFPFTGHMPVVLVLTLIFGFAIAAVSYALVESPCREALRRWEYRTAMKSQPLDSSVSDSPSRASRTTASSLAAGHDLVADRRSPGLAGVVAQRTVDELDGRAAPCSRRCVAQKFLHRRARPVSAPACTSA